MTTITTTVPAVRTFILAFLILAGSLGAAFAMPAQEAAAAGPCLVGANVKYYASNGSYYMYARGGSACEYAVDQSVMVRLYAYTNANGYILARSWRYTRFTQSLVGNTNATLAHCGVWYRAKVEHSVIGYAGTNTWSTFFKLC